MQSASQMVPRTELHVQDSALCASCHTLYTHARGPNGEILGQLPEQVPYLEWKHSAFYQNTSCQSCHMPQLTNSMHITSVMGQPRENFSKHVFRGGNFFMPKIFNRNRKELGVSALPQDLILASQQTEDHLQNSSARVKIDQVQIAEDSLKADVVVTNLAGHKLPTAYPSRRAWLHFTVSDAQGKIVFESGKVNPDGSIQGNVNDHDKNRFEKHHEQINRQDQVQIYEAIMADIKGNVTTGLIEATEFIKDNRILPMGFNKATASEDIMVQGRAGNDRDFSGAKDTVHYHVQIDRNQGPFTIQAELMYQPIAFRWAHNLKEEKGTEIDRFVSYYEDMARQSWIVLAQETRNIK